MTLTDDGKGIIEIIKEAVGIVLEESGVVTKKDLKYIPNSDEFNSRMDEMMGELKTIREEVTMSSQHSKDHSDSIENLQKIHPNNSHHNFA